MQPRVNRLFQNPYRRWIWVWWLWWVTPRNWRNLVVWAWQRATRGWADCDAWSVDHYLNCIVPPMLERLKRSSGYPGKLAPESIWDGGESNKEEDAKAHLAWLRILDAIIDGFKAAVEEEEGPPPSIQAKLVTSPQEGMEAYRAWYASLEERRRESFKLMAEWYLALWD